MGSEAAVSFLLDNLKVLLAERYNLISSAEKQLRELKENLESMKNLLQDNANIKCNTQTYTALKQQIRLLIYEAEDAVDELINYASRKNSFAKSLSSTYTGLIQNVSDVGGQLKDLYTKAKNQFEEMKKYGTADALDDIKISLARESKPVKDKEIVGFQDEIERLVDDLTDEKNKQVEAITIVGMPGMGKTTVAVKIFFNPKIKYHFPKPIWVTVSKYYNPRRIYLEILKEFTDDDMSSKSDKELSYEVEQYLRRVKFLLVVDDVWTPDAWECIKDALPKDDDASGKVLITSRHVDVAKAANARRKAHELRFLTQDESWELLQKEVYGRVGVWPQELIPVGKLVSEACDRLPLSLVLIKGVLTDKMSDDIELTKKAWMEVSENVTKHMSEKEKTMENIISMSYDSMPYAVRDCFLYLGVFPEDYEISVWRLTQLWLAEGLITGEELEETAKKYLHDLVNRNLVMVEKKNAMNEIKTCKVHDTIREFCKGEAEEHVLFREFKMEEDSEEDYVSKKLQKCRRVCIHSKLLDFFRERPTSRFVRSFLSNPRQAIVVPPEDYSSIFDAFELLRVFEGNSMAFERYPTKLSQLQHLRYITLSATDTFCSLPDVVKKIWSLQTLVIETVSREFEIKFDISDAGRLRHLKTDAALVFPNPKKKGSKSKTNKCLRTLKRLSTKSCNAAFLGKVPNLETLAVRGQLTDVGTDCFESLRRVTNLKLFNESAGERSLEKLPGFPQRLTSLTLSGTSLSWAQMEKLGQLSNLVALKLKDHAFVGSGWECMGGLFRSLRYLKIERLDLVFWTAPDTSFTRLKTLVVKQCERLLDIPISLANSLNTMELERAKKAVNSARAIEKKISETREKNSQEWSAFKLIIAAGDLQ